MDNAVTNGKHLVSDEENIEQKTQVANRLNMNQTSERWTPYFKSKRLTSLNHDEAMQSATAGDEEAGDSKDLETAAMQVRVQLFNDFHTFWKIVRRATFWTVT